MSDAIKHECGLAYIRLRKPFSHFLDHYGSILFGINKLYLLMEKQHNRGQDGAGLATIKLNTPEGYPFMHRMRSGAQQPIADIFHRIGEELKELEKYQPDLLNNPEYAKGHLDFLGEIMLGHLRYGTQGKNDFTFCHPFIKKDYRPSRNLALAGNFNLVNTEELFALINMQPGEFQLQSDLAAMMEILLHFLAAEEENSDTPNLENVLRKSLELCDGGYNVSGLLGNGWSFVVRDANGIRPSYYYIHEDYIVAASERSAIRTCFNVGENEVLELMPGCALIVDDKGQYKITQILEPKERRACSFERIYFSRGNDEKIYRERIALGHKLSRQVLEAIDHDLKNTIFSYIPNTAEVAYYGLVKGMEDYLTQIKVQRILSWANDIDEERLSQMLNRKIRQEKIAIKDVKMRTFISEDSTRNDLVQHVYDITYGTVRPWQDRLVVIDDSIVRGTTLRESIVRMLSRLRPTEILIVSSAPQIRYPDCYGIDMSKLADFVAFQAALDLLKENGDRAMLTDLYRECKELHRNNLLHTKNMVKEIYAPFSDQVLSQKIAQLISPPNQEIPVKVIYQSINDLHDACPTNTGDWYFTGNYPTPGGNRVCNRAFINFMEGKNKRGY